MIRRIVAGLRIVGILIIAHALMLLGADEISTIEAGGVRTIRSSQHILTLYGADPASWYEGSSEFMAWAMMTVLGLPAWGVLAVLGGLLVLVARRRD